MKRVLIATLSFLSLMLGAIVIWIMNDRYDENANHPRLVSMGRVGVNGKSFARFRFDAPRDRGCYVSEATITSERHPVEYPQWGGSGPIGGKYPAGGSTVFSVQESSEAAWKFRLVVIHEETNSQAWRRRLKACLRDRSLTPLKSPVLTGRWQWLETPPAGSESSAGPAAKLVAPHEPSHETVIERPYQRRR